MEQRTVTVSKETMEAIVGALQTQSLKYEPGSIGWKRWNEIHQELRKQVGDCYPRMYSE